MGNYILNSFYFYIMNALTKQLMRVWGFYMFSRECGSRCFWLGLTLTAYCAVFLTRLVFTVVSEPPEDEGDCVDVAYASVDFTQVCTLLHCTDLSASILWAFDGERWLRKAAILILCGDRTLEESAIRHFRNDKETVAKKTIAVTFRLQLTSRFLSPVAYIDQFRIIKIHTWEIKGK